MSMLRRAFVQNLAEFHGSTEVVQEVLANLATAVSSRRSWRAAFTRYRLLSATHRIAGPSIFVHKSGFSNFWNVETGRAGQWLPPSATVEVVVPSTPSRSASSCRAVHVVPAGPMAKRARIMALRFFHLLFIPFSFVSLWVLSGDPQCVLEARDGQRCRALRHRTGTTKRRRAQGRGVRA